MNGYQFWVSAGDVQMDEKINNSNGFEQLRSWDAVWESKARITNDGWVVEMKVPFSELRFPNNGEAVGVDFTEVEPYDLILNLSTTETQFAEKRTFFTEGTELFSRGGIFYSKRIGKNPSEYNDVKDALDDGACQSIKKNPLEAKLINATKISGRTNKGLGIGFFNAITNSTYAEVVNQDGQEKIILTDPFSNYNMLVFDQSLKNNSYLSFFNTNVWCKNDYVANVSGTEFRLEINPAGDPVLYPYYTEDHNVNYNTF